MDPASFGMAAELQDSKARLQFAIQALNVGLWDYDAQSGKVRADPGQIEQALINLAVNARDAMPRGGKLLIETADVVFQEQQTRQHAQSRPAPHVMLSVSDTGHGMGEETLSHIFEPFFTTKGLGKGTGLGLSTVYGIVQQSGGSITVASQPGQGTTFQIYLPRVEEAAERPAAAPANAVQPQGSETVLLVEDEVQVRHLVRTFLKDMGYTILEALSPGDAIRLCKQHDGPIHLMLSDVVMPGMSGPELAEHVQPLRQQMKVLYMSGYTDEAINRHKLGSSEVDFIQKPFRPGTLARKLREILARPH